ncbi:MAG: hypothetical protein KAS32_24395 [Candidatus Peribacteraceae bacterium]|nr:hypothetical protein [Candidatus Peribacteraceae bacterium]
MKKYFFQKRQIQSVILFMVAISLAVFSVNSLWLHARLINVASQVSPPLVAEIPVLEAKLENVTQQVEMAQLHAASRIGSQAEQVDILIYPSEPDFDRLIAFFDIFREYSEGSDVLQNFSSIDIGDALDHKSSVVYPISLKFNAHTEGMNIFFPLVRLAGLLTIGDALSSDERALLLYRTEQENPAGIVALEQFFSTDLMQYAKDSHSHEQRLLRSFSSDSFLSAFHGIVKSSLLKEAKMIFGGEFGAMFSRHSLWPLPLLSLGEVTLRTGGSPGWNKVDVELLLYTRHVGE